MIRPTLEWGEEVAIFTDPWTEQHIEGRAVLVEPSWPRNYWSEYWWVRWIDDYDKELHHREIRIDDEAVNIRRREVCAWDR